MKSMVKGMERVFLTQPGDVSGRPSASPTIDKLQVVEPRGGDTVMNHSSSND